MLTWQLSKASLARLCNRQVIIVMVTTVSQYAAVANEVAAPSSFSATRLLLPEGAELLSPSAISETGEVGGYVRHSSSHSPFAMATVWDAHGAPASLYVPGDYTQAGVIGFSTDGIPVGYLHTETQFPGPAVVWKESGMESLAHLGNGAAAFGASKDVIVGAAYRDAGGYYVSNAVIWDASGLRVLPGLGEEFSRTISVNVNSVYVGITADRVGFWGTDGSVNRLNYPGFVNTSPVEVNDSGWFSGNWQPDLQVFRRRGFVANAFLDVAYDLGLFPGYQESFIGGINNSRTVVGAARNTGDYEQALVWLEGSLVPENLNKLVDVPGVTFIRGMDVNNAGQILAEARLNDGSGYAYYRLSPIVPEPGGIAVMALCGLLAARRRFTIPVLPAPRSARL